MNKGGCNWVLLLFSALNQSSGSLKHETLASSGFMVSVVEEYILNFVLYFRWTKAKQRGFLLKVKFFNFCLPVFFLLFLTLVYLNVFFGTKVVRSTEKVFENLFRGRCCSYKLNIAFNFFPGRQREHSKSPVQSHRYKVTSTTAQQALENFAHQQ